MSSIVLTGAYTSGQPSQLKLLISELNGTTGMTNAAARLSALTLTHTVKSSGAIINGCQNRNILNGINGSVVYNTLQGTAPNQYNVLVTLAAEDLALIGAGTTETQVFEAAWAFDTSQTGVGTVEFVLTKASEATITLLTVGLSPASVTNNVGSTGTVTVDIPAPVGGIVVTLTSSNTSAATVPASVTILAGHTTATFAVTTLNVASNQTSTITATYSGTSRTAVQTVNTLTADYYVAQTGGSDSYDGTAAAHTTGSVGPFLTIQKAINVVAAGKTVAIRAGTYAEALTTSGKASGSAGSIITFQAYGDGPVTVFPATGAPLEHVKDYWNWEYIELKGSTSNTLYVHNCANVNFIYCLGRKGTNPVYLVAATNIGFYNDVFSELGSCIWLASGSTLTMRNCLVTGNNAQGGGTAGINVTAGCTLDIDYCLVTGNGPPNTPTTQIKNAGTLIDGGHNIINARSRVNGFTVVGGGVKALLGFCTDDYVSPAYDLAIAQAAAVYGMHTSHGVVATSGIGHGAALQTLFNMGEEIASHSYDHPDLVLWTQAFTVQYTGGAATCTITISGGALTLTSSNGGAENHSVTLSGLDLDGAIAAINAFTSYTATRVVQENIHNALSLADVAAHDIKTTYTALFDKTSLTTYEVTDSKALLESLVTGLTVTTFVYPLGSEDATVQAAVLATGALVGLGATSSAGSLASVSMYNLNRLGSNYLDGTSEADTRARARWLAEYAKACGGIVIVENHLNGISVDNAGYCFSEWSLDPDVTFLTVAQIGAAIRADHSTADGGLTWTKTYSDAFDMSLQTGSPCINAGVDVGLVFDHVGTAVPQGAAPDIGAYEKVA